MAQPYVGEIRMFAGNFAPAGWMFCSGQLLPISENETLFNLIGTTYGGDGKSNFADANTHYCNVKGHANGCLARRLSLRRPKSIPGEMRSGAKHGSSARSNNIRQYMSYKIGRRCV